MKKSKQVINSRREKIIELLKNRSEVQTDFLSDYLDVSTLTIRRDLEYLVHTGVVERFYGGVRLINLTEERNNLDNKHSIAKEAATYVNNGDTIFINTSSTALLVLHYIKNKKVTVITNNANAIFIDKDQSISLFLTGGEIRHPKESMVGDFAISNIQKVTANKAFIGCDGLSIKGGVSTSVLQEATINSLMLQRVSEQNFLLVESFKIGIESNFQSSLINAVDTIITDKLLRADFEEELKLEGAQIIKVS